MTAIVDLILEELETVLTTKLITEVDDSDDSKADLVKIGRFLENPKQKNVHVWISHLDPEEPDWTDGLAYGDDSNKVQFNVPTREIGGGEAWWRKGIVDWGCYYLKGKTEDEARELAHTVDARIQKAVKSCTVSHLTDTYDEHAYMMFLASSSISPTGGGGKWIWRGKCQWQVLTFKE